jgi:hypothetical protein
LRSIKPPEFYWDIGSLIPLRTHTVFSEGSFR